MDIFEQKKTYAPQHNLLATTQELDVFTAHTYFFNI